MSRAVPVSHAVRGVAGWRMSILFFDSSESRILAVEIRNANLSARRIPSPIRNQRTQYSDNVSKITVEIKCIKIHEADFRSAYSM